MSLHIEIHKCTQVGFSQQFLGAWEKDHLFLGSRGMPNTRGYVIYLYTAVLVILSPNKIDPANC